jgi:glycine/D-amino acid oxidase-like deaminating enzyme
VAVIGGGFTGLSAALHLAQAGQHVSVFEAQHPGWGASGRNGGFCCLGGAKAPDRLLTQRFGPNAPQEWARVERAAVDLVDSLITRNSWEVDRHSQGETLLAHRPRHWQAMQRDAQTLADLYETDPQLIAPQDLEAQGLGGPWHGGMTLPIGFALNPRKYHKALAQAADDAGAQLFEHSPVTALRRGDGWVLDLPQARVLAKRVIIATNGYSSEDLPHWLRARYLPVQSSVIVTRPLTKAEQAAQGWHSDQMAYDTRQLLHYFRKLPGERFLFGMRGGLTARARESAAISRRIRREFHQIFPAWREVEITHEWSGLVCMMRGLTPFVGAVPGHSGLYAALGYHGNGVAMGTYAGALIARHLCGKPLPEIMQSPPKRFPLGGLRRHLLRPAYLAAQLLDL